MQTKYLEICKILDLPTHSITMTGEKDQNGAIVCETYELNDEQAIANIINELQKETKQ